MSKTRRKSPYPESAKSKRKRERRERNLAIAQSAGLSPGIVAELVVDFWKIERRAISTEADSKVIAACERAADRMKKIGFEIDTLMERPFNVNLRIKVIEHEDDSEPKRIVECLTPAVYFEGQLLREAEVVTRGR